MEYIGRTRKGFRTFSLVIAVGCGLLFLTWKHAPQIDVWPLRTDPWIVSDNLGESLTKYHSNNSNHTVQWIVLDSLTLPCDDVSSWTRQEDWNVLIVTDDQKIVTGCRPPKCLQLTWKECQAELGHLDTFRDLGVPSKLFGYLLAIKRGAEVILDADCNTAVENISSRFFVSELDQSGLLYNISEIFNPFHHWGYVSAYPKQFFNLTDQKQIENVSNKDIFYVVDIMNVSIRQGVILSESTCYQNIKIGQRIDTTISQGSPVFIGPKTLAPLNTGPTLFYKNSFMWMFFPPDVVTPVAQFFRTRWLHQLSKMYHVTLSYYDLTSWSLHNLKPFGDVCETFNASSSEMDNYWDCLPDIKCPNGEDFIECSFVLAQEVIECLNADAMSLSSKINLTQIILVWQNDLIKLGASSRLERTPSKNIFKIRYGVKSQNLQIASQNTVNESIVGSITSLCGQNNRSFSQYYNHSSKPMINDILLIVVINYESLFKTLPLMEFIHRQYFKHIVYCGPSVDKFIQYADSLGLTYVTYIDGMTHSWLFFYECVTHAMKLRLPVRGYLQIGEDVLLNSWNLNRLPRDHIWFPKGFDKIPLYEPRPGLGWVHWNHPFGQKAVVNTFSELKNSSSMPSTDQVNTRFHSFARRFLENYASNFDSNFIIYGGTDIFYIPDILRDDYIIASELFRKHKVMTEIAVPVLHLGLVRYDSITYIKGDALWGGDRDKPWTFFNASQSIFIHPFKLFSNAQTGVGNHFYCKTFMDVYESFL